MGAYVYDGVLALDAGHQLLLLDVHDQVFALEVSRYAGDCDVDVCNRLRPAVGEGILLSLLLGTGGFLFGLGGFWKSEAVVSPARMDIRRKSDLCLES